VFFFSSRRRHTISKRDWSSDVCSSDLTLIDTEKTIIKSFQKTLSDTYGITPTAEELFYVLGIPGTKAVKRYVHSETESQKLLAEIGRASCRERGKMWRRRDRRKERKRE